MMSQKQALALCPPLGLVLTSGEAKRSKASDLRALPAGQRTAMLARAAECLAGHYATDPELNAFDAFDEESEGAHA